MPSDDDLLLQRLKNVAGRIREEAVRASSGPDLSAHAASAFGRIGEDAAYLVGEIENHQGPASDRWKCQKCARLALTRKRVRANGLPPCRTCGGVTFSAIG